MGYTIKISDAKTSKRYKDKNGYLHIPNNQIAKAGVFDYLLREVTSNYTQDNADEIVKVCRTFDDLQKNKDLFSKMPIILGHHWVGEEQDKVAGAIGEKITAQEPYLYADLIIYSQELIDAIENGNIVELSPGYEADILEESGEYDGEPYSYEQKLKQVNHLAVVENGRSGKDLRLQDEKNQKTPSKGAKMGIQKIADALAGMLKKIKDEEGVEPKKTEDEDKRELIKEIMAISAKPVEEFDGGEDEKVETISKLAEKLAYNPSETSKVDDEDEPNKEENKPTADENEPKDDSKSEKQIADSLIAIINAKFDALEKKAQRTQDENAVAYAEVSKIVGEFSSSGMSASEIYAHGYKCLAGRVLDSGIDAKSAFKVKASELQPKFTQTEPTSVRQQDSKMSETQLSLLANIK